MFIGRLLLMGLPAAVALGGVAVLAVRSQRKRRADGLRGRLLRNARDPEPDAPGVELPEPVRRYLEYALPPGTPPIRTASLRQTGTFRLGGIGSGWKPLEATQSFSSSPPAFVWEARIRMAPALAIQVVDSYLGGEGAIHATAASLIPIVDRKGAPELNAGALMRFLAEAVWIPTRLRPGDGLSWQPMDQRRARAILEDGPNRVELEFTFGDDGRIETIFAPGRFRDVDGIGVPTPWICRLGMWASVHGFRAPLEGEVAWVLPEGELVYWRGKISEIRFQLASDYGASSGPGSR